jgi:hypothetical protein
MHKRSLLAIAAVGVIALSVTGWAFQPSASEADPVAAKAFFKPDLVYSTQNVHLDQARQRLAAGQSAAWDQFLGQYADRDINVYLDPRTGTPTAIQGHFPLIPGDGVDNKLTFKDMSAQFGVRITKVDATLVGNAVLDFIRDHAAVMNVNLEQLGTPRVTRIHEQLWQVHIPQQVNGVPVRHARIAASISHGNLVLIGTESWANVTASTQAAVSSSKALEAGLGHLGFIQSPQALWKNPELELLPHAPPFADVNGSFQGMVGQGLSHRLVWTYGVNHENSIGTWQVSVDAQSGEIVEIADQNQYAQAQIYGGIYPSTNTGICPTPETCGTMQPSSPMPHANTGLASPNDYTNAAGVYNPAAGNATTTLSGRYVRIVDNCGSISFNNGSTDLNMGGQNNDHDCTTPGFGGAGNTAASRSCYYETNKLQEQARGWLSSNTWLTQQLTANVNIANTCNAFWNGSSVNFYRSGGGCRNTGEIGAVFDHEWGHGMDDFDANGTLSNSSEAYADIAAIYRLQTSCVGHGFFWTSDRGCGQTADGTGFNQNEAQSGAAHCNTNCSGVRDADWAKHSDNTPDTPQNFVCPKCTSSSGPCGRQVHCAAAPVRQAAWDLVTRDLTAAPFNYDSNTAFIVGNKLFYQGSGNVGTWHACDCTAGTADGCGATNGYMQWLTADDDNGNLNDGTPHMTAIRAAFARHNIACATPTPVNSGCSSGPTSAPSLTASSGDGTVSLNWTSVSGATRYWVMKTEGYAGCNFGKALVATSTTLSYTDTTVANGRQYCYSVVPAAASNACFAPASNCTCVTPNITCGAPQTACSGTCVDTQTNSKHCGACGNACQSGQTCQAGVCSCGVPGVSNVSPANGATGVATNPLLDWSDATGATSYEVQVATDSAFTNVVRSATALTSSQWTVTPLLSNGTTYFWRARAVAGCGPGAYSAATSFTTQACVAPAAPTLTSPANGAAGVAVSPTLDWGDVASASSYEVQVATDSAFTNVVRSATALTSSQWTVSPALSPVTTYFWRARAVGCTTGAYSGGFSFTTANVCGLTTAAYDSTLRAPKCNSGVCGCDTGTSLVNSRGTMAPAEPNQPNTINTSAACADGTSGTYHSDESLDRLSIQTTDASPLDAGKQVRIEATVWCWGTSDALDLYYASNAASPSWTFLSTQACTGTGATVFTHTFTLSAGGSQQVVRGQFRYGGSASTCTSGSYNDRDDLVFGVGSCSAPGVATLQTPANGATGQSTSAVLDWSDVTGATSYDVQVASDSAFANVVRSGTATTSTWTVSPALSNSTTYYWRVRANNGCGAGAWSGGFSFTTAAGCTISASAYDATFRTQRCASTSCGCDSGTAGLNSRGTLATPEPNQPNTLAGGAACADGSSGSYHVDESIDRVSVRTTDGSNLSVGKTVQIDITAWCWGTSDWVDVYYTSNASTPSWTVVGTAYQCPSAGAKTITRTVTLGSAVGAHAVRAQIRYSGTASSCTTGSYNDHDDLVFHVSSSATGTAAAR